MKSDTLLITGATGFLGSNILKNIINKYSKIIVIKRSTSNINRIKDIKNLIFYNIDQVKIEDIFKDNKIDCIIHCATNYGRREIEPFEIIEANFILPLKLMHFGSENKLKYFINTDTMLDKRINFYSLSKNQFKHWMEMYSSKLICINMELEHFYGPLDDNSKFVTYIIHSLLNNVEKIDLTLGEQKRYFIFIDDVVNAFEIILENINKFNKGVYNFQVGSEDSIDIKKFVELVKNLTGNSNTFLNFGTIPYRKNEIMEPKIDLIPLKKIGWKPKVSLEKGLMKTIEIEKNVLDK